MNKEKLKNAWKVIKEACSAVAIGFVTIIIGFFLGFVRGRKNVSDNRNGASDARKQLEDISRDSDRLAETNKSTEDILRKVREREVSSSD